jgi:hypothetical protein
VRACRVLIRRSMLRSVTLMYSLQMLDDGIICSGFMVCGRRGRTLMTALLRKLSRIIRYPILNAMIFSFHVAACCASSNTYCMSMYDLRLLILTLSFNMWQNWKCGNIRLVLVTFHVRNKTYKSFTFFSE